MNRRWARREISFRTLAAIFLELLLSLAVVAQQLEIHHIDVGQADATLIKSPTGITVLIDGGNTGNGTNIILPYLTTLGITRLAYVACSHYHADHLGGLDEVINGMGVSNIGTVYDRGRDTPLPATTGFTQYETAANATGRRSKVSLGQELDLGGGAVMKCVATDGEVLNYGLVSGATGSENDLSVGWVLTYKSFRYFTGGDLGGESSSYADSETPLGPQVGDVDVMKINHHGSQYSTNQSFVNNLKPEVAVIQVGNGNSYSHPVQSTLNRLAAANCYVYQTESGSGGTIPAGKGILANGNIIVKTTGLNYTLSFGSTVTVYTLSVEMTSFHAAVDGSVVRLSWSTAAEVNNSGFEIERRQINDPDWVRLGFVPGSGTSNTASTYSFADLKCPSGRFAYRLKQLDKDGSFKYSHSVDAEILSTTFSLSQNYPNPFNPATAIRYSLPFQSLVRLHIFNPLGQEIAELVNGEQTPGEKRVAWNPSIAAGVYFYRIEAVSVSDPSRRYVDTKKMILLQ